MTVQPASGAPPSGSAVHDEPAADRTEDVFAAIDQVRAGIVTLATGAYLLAVAAIVIVFSMTTRLGILEAVSGVVLAVGLAALLARLLLRRALRRADRLGTLSLALTNLYDRARLDALRDGLTGLGNHRAFQDELERAGQMARRHGLATALLLIDVDDLKRTNDLYGHTTGDEVLSSVARVLVASLRRIDRAFRIGGDEFAILSPGTAAAAGEIMARRILVALLESDRNPGGQPISVTIGVSAMPWPSPDRAQLYRHADAALYWGKRHGRTDVQVFDPDVHGIADDERPAEELALAVDRIVERSGLLPYYQPIYSLVTGRVLGFEGLVRLEPGSGFRTTSALFEAAESVNRTVELDVEAARRLAAGAGRLAPDHYLAVNLSPRTLEASAFNPHEVLAIFARVGIAPERLVIELTEREAVEDMERLAHSLAVLRRTGARIAADDVGAGNAGLRLLSQLEFDVIKLDLSLVQGGAMLAPTRAVVRALLELTDRRGATTVAEGIETASQLEMLRDLGIRVGQGYLLGRPRAEPEAAPADVDVLLAFAELEHRAAAEAASAARSDPVAAA
jgi:diguanylate cyclase (GGDEF)-like protein